jgi:hypothetical protein
MCKEIEMAIKVTVTTSTGSFSVENDDPAAVADFLEMAGVELGNGEVHGPAGRLRTNDIVEEDTHLFVSKPHSNAQ